MMKNRLSAPPPLTRTPNVIAAEGPQTTTVGPGLPLIENPVALAASGAGDSVGEGEVGGRIVVREGRGDCVLVADGLAERRGGCWVERLGRGWAVVSGGWLVAALVTDGLAGDEEEGDEDGGGLDVDVDVGAGGTYGSSAAVTVTEESGRISATTIISSATAGAAATSRARWTARDRIIVTNVPLRHRLRPQLRTERGISASPLVLTQPSSGRRFPGEVARRSTPTG